MFEIKAKLSFWRVWKLMLYNVHYERVWSSMITITNVLTS